MIEPRLIILRKRNGKENNIIYRADFQGIFPTQFNHMCNKTLTSSSLLLNIVDIF